MQQQMGRRMGAAVGLGLLVCLGAGAYHRSQVAQQLKAAQQEQRQRQQDERERAERRRQEMEEEARDAAQPLKPSVCTMGGLVWTKERQQQYQAALQAGRLAAGQGQLEAARQQLRQAVKLDPESRTASAELGWVMYQLKDLDAAERALRWAVHFHERPRVQAGRLYQLGQVLAAQGKQAEAVQRYQEAWQLGHDPVMLAALKALDPSVVVTSWPSMQPLQEASLQAMQAAMQAAVDQDIFGDCTQTEVKLASGGALKRAFLVSTKDYSLDSNVKLWVQTHLGWFSTLVGKAETHREEGSTIKVLSAKAVGNLVELRIQFIKNYWVRQASGMPQRQSGSDGDNYLYVLGIGKSGRPSLSSGIYFASFRSAEQEHAGIEYSGSKTCPVVVLPSGKLHIGAPVIKTKKMSAKEFTRSELRMPLGTFQLKFP
jgi:tetratricopeptide (TPR) repeat protein